MRFHRSRIAALTALGTSLVGLMSCTQGVSKSEQTAPSVAVTNDVVAARAYFASAPLGRVVARDAGGSARFIVGALQPAAVPAKFSAETAARIHLSRHAPLLGLTEAAVQDAILTATHDLPEGAGIVQFKQRVNGVDVFHSRASVVLDATKNLVSIGNGFQPAAVGGVSPKQFSFRSAPEVALAHAYAAQAGIALPAGAVHDSGPLGDEARGYTIRASEGALRILDATAKRVLYPEGKALVPAYYVELVARAPGSNENQARAYVVAADDGRLLYDVSLTANDAFNYRVWADGNATTHYIPLDGPMVDYTPHPAGIPDKSSPGYIPPIMVAMESFKTKPAGVIDPWLGATDTFTFGNNVKAYSDRNDYLDDAGLKRNDGYDEGIDIRADVTSAKTFDRIFNVAQPPEFSTDQIKAAVTQIFYTTNWLHDYWYDSGFDEKSGVAQLSNFGRGGFENDPLRAEAQDSAVSGQANNANMSTLSDGRSPRMQMYVWNGIPNRQLVTTPPITINDGIGAAGFGPQTFDVTGTVVLSNDNSTVVPPPATVGTTSDGCQVPINVTGMIAVIDRGSCNFTVKAANAQTGGATGIILLNNAPGHVPSNPGGVVAVTIPLLSLSFEEGQALKTALGAGAVTAHLTRGPEIQHDGTIDNTVVAHEWGHYLHHRLVVCGSASCGGMSEGWADFDAVLLVIRAGDTFDNKTYAVAQYASAGLGQNYSYFGIRRAPYSTDMTKNPFTFGHIRRKSTLPTTAPLAPASPDMSEVHNVGEIWTQTLFEAYVNLLAAGSAATPPRDFETTKRRMADYIVAGMKAAPAEPTFVEQRDAFLSAVLATGRTDDFIALARGFARRGLGSGAEAPPTSSTTLDEAVENFDVKGNLTLVDAALDDSVRSCDGDGNLDKGEAGKVTIKVQNTGWEKLTQTQVKLTTTDPKITFDSGGVVTIASLDPYEIKTVTVGVSAADTVTKRALLPLAVTLSDPAAVKPTADTSFQALYNFDDMTGSSAMDDVESVKTAWTLGHNAAVPLRPDFMVWSRQGVAQNHVWHGDDFGVESDESLVSPKLDVSPTNPFVISFIHRYSFETGPAVPGGPNVAFDGGVLEITEDDGATWNDISKYVDPGYPVTLYSSRPSPGDGGATEAGTGGDASDAAVGEPDTNVLAGRKAWGIKSPGYPSYLNVSLDLGTKLAGKTVKVRFRIATDAGGGEAGWDIDNIAFGSSSFAGITNTPFSSIVDNPVVCADGGAGGTDGGADAGERADARPDTGASPRRDASADAEPPSNPPPPSDSGCGCRTADMPTRSAPAFALSLLAALFAARRKRRP